MVMIRPFFVKKEGEHFLLMNLKNGLFHHIRTNVLIILGVLVLTAALSTSIVLALSVIETAGSIDKSMANESGGSTTIFLPLISKTGKILCDGKVYDGYSKAKFVLQTAEDRDPSIQKIIRNCTFTNSTEPAIVLANAQNVLIEGNHFENIRTNIPGSDVVAIDIRCDEPCNIDNVTITNNTFNNIGSDGILLGNRGRTIKNVIIQNNFFQGSETIGENGVDIKGVDGPIYVLGNTMQGFRPCESPKTDPPGIQDCSGDGGAAFRIHNRASSLIPATNIVVEGNYFYNNTLGLVIGDGASYITIRNNNFSDNLSIGLHIKQASNVLTQNNKFRNNSQNLVVGSCLNCTLK